MAALYIWTECESRCSGKGRSWLLGSTVFVVGWSRGGVGGVCDFCDNRPIQGNCENQLEGGTCSYSIFFWHNNASIVERDFF